jgi:hypothetical protein
MRNGSKARFHYGMCILWTLLLVPSALWWKSSILWVIFMSVYAIVATHWSIAQGARAERAANKDED